MTITTVRPVTWTPRQTEAAGLLRSEAPAVLFYGGSRSGKTLLLVEWIFRQCVMVPGLRAIVARYRRQHAKDTIWRETILGEVLPRWGELGVNHSDLVVDFPNGSSIGVGGTDDQTRLEKLLGKGAGIVYLNELSQLSYGAFALIRTRLSQKLEYAPGTPRAGQTFVPRLIGDCNPPAPTHWAHRVFIDHVEPRDGRQLDPRRYVSMRLNPIDNAENLPESYLRELDELPDMERRRFRDGEWVKPEGAIYPEYGEQLLIDEAPECEQYFVGIDLITYAAVLIGMQRYQRDGGEIGTRIYCIDEWRQVGALAHEAETAINARWGDRYRFKKVIDHNLGAAGTREFEDSRLAKKGPGSVEAGIAFLQRAMHRGEFYVCRRCKVLHYELENYHRDETGAIVKVDDHGPDAVRYGTDRLWAGKTVKVWVPGYGNT